MNRQILFRGKRIIEPIKIDRYAPNGWVCGGLIEVDDEEAYILPYDISGEMYRNRPYRFRANDFEYTIMLAEVDPKTIGQFTGLTDKNGKKIFEGDIVKVTTGIEGYKSTYHSTIQEVKYNAEMCGIAVFLPFDNSDMVEVEVIGNIYDNKELLR
jgi:hypothetical protein